MKFYPVGLPVFVYSPQFEGVGGFCREVFKEQRGVFDGGVEHVVEADFIEVGVVHFFPGGGEFVGFCVCVGNLCVCRGRECACAYPVVVGGVEYVSVEREHGGVSGDVRRSEFYEQLRVFGDDLFFKFASFGGKAVDVRRSVVEVYVLFFPVFVDAGGFGEFYFAFSDFSREFFRFFGYVDFEFGGFFFYEAVEVAFSRVYGYRYFVFGIEVGFYEGGYTFAVAVLFGDSVVVVFGEGGVSVGVYFVYPQVFVDFGYVVVGVCHRDDCSAFHEYGEFPNGGCKVAEDAVALVFFPGEVVDPRSFGEVDAVADVVARLIGVGSLIDRCNEEVWAIQELVLCGFALCVGVRVFEEHGPDHRHAVDCFFGDAVCVGDEFGF